MITLTGPDGTEHTYRALPSGFVYLYECAWRRDHKDCIAVLENDPRTTIVHGGPNTMGHTDAYWKEQQ